MANLPPAEKLPLAVRKNVRDEWEAKKPDFEKELSGILGTAWTFDINPLAIFPYAEEGSYGHRSLGSCISAYVEGAVGQIKRFANAHGKAGTSELNAVCPTHTVTMMASTEFNYCGCSITDGKLNILFNPKNLGTNVNDALNEIAKVISKAPQPEGAPKLSFAARRSIASNYDEAIVPVLEKARKLLHNPKLEFDPDFENVGAMLKSGKDVRDDWERNLGSFAVLYFESFANVLQREKFGDDDMLREGFEEAASKGIVKLRLVEKMSGYNAVLIEDGVCILQTTPANYGTNVNDTAHKLVDIL